MVTLNGLHFKRIAPATRIGRMTASTLQALFRFAKLFSTPISQEGVCHA